MQQIKLHERFFGAVLGQTGFWARQKVMGFVWSEKHNG